MTVFDLHLHALYAWSQDNQETALAALDGVDAKQRRRLSHLAKLSLSAQQGLSTQTDTSAVTHILWCSSYGDEHKTLQILHSIADNETPSPTAFATSVHNATAGLYSMLSQNSVPSSSLNVGVTEFVHALLYAHALLKTQTNASVLLIAADEPLPDVYPCQPLQHAYAMACLLSLGHENCPSNVSLQHTPNPKIQYKRPEALLFAEFWHSNQVLLPLDHWQVCKTT